MGTFILPPKQTMVPGFPVNNFYTKAQSDAKFAPIGETSAYTPGSIIFAQTDGTLTQDNASLFYDGTNHYLGLGTNTPSSILTIEQDGLGGAAGSLATSLVLQNTTAAASGLQQVSPAIILSGNGWGTTTPASANVSWRVMVLPTQGTANPTSTLQFQSSIAGAAYIQPMSISSTGTLIVSPAASTTAAFQTNTTATSSNLVVVSTGLASSSLVNLLYGGASTTQYRMFMRGSTNTVLTSLASSAAFVIGNMSYTTASAATVHPWLSQLVIKPLTITAGTATVANSATVYIEDAATGATNNYALYVAAGGVSFQSLSAGGLVKSTSGLLSVATVGTDYVSPSNTTTFAALQTFPDNTFKLINAADNTKTGVFNLGSMSTGTAVTYSVPSGALTAITLATISNVTQTFAGTTTFSGTFTVNAVTQSFGSGTAAITANIGNGGTLSGNTKTINIGTGGASGSTTNINLGSATAGATTNITANAPITLKGYTVATLPTGTQGMTAFVTDALAPTFGTTAVGGGAVVIPVFYNGTTWVSY